MKEFLEEIISKLRLKEGEKYETIVFVQEGEWHVQSRLREWENAKKNLLEEVTEISDVEMEYDMLSKDWLRLKWPMNILKKIEL